MVRFKNRYILAEIEFPTEEQISQQISETTLLNVDRSQIYLSVRQSKKVYNPIMEILGLPRWHFHCKYLNLMTRICIVRVAREYEDILSTSMIFVTGLGGRKAKLRQLHCSGTIKKIEMKARNLLVSWLNAFLKKESITKSLELELREIIEKEFVSLENMEQ